MARDPDLFEGDSQADLFGEAETSTYQPDIHKVRARLQKILAETRAAEELPWGKASLYRTIFPQMTLWLPEEEAAQCALSSKRKWSGSKPPDVVYPHFIPGGKISLTLIPPRPLKGRFREAS